MFKISVMIILSLVFSACTYQDVKRFAYDTAASDQCYRDAKANPHRDPFVGCAGEKRLDGMEYDEYEKMRTE